MKIKIPILGIILIFILTGCETNLPETVEAADPVTDTPPRQELPEEEPMEQEEKQPPLEETGTLALVFSSTPGGGPAEAAYRVYETGAGESPIAAGTGSQPVIALTEGTYDLYVEGTESGAWTRCLSVSAGQQTERTIVLSHGTLEVEFIHRDSLQPVWAEYRIYPAGEWERIIVWDSGSECIEYLQGGVYDLYYAWEDGDGWIRDIALTPGSLVEKVVALPAD